MASSSTVPSKKTPRSGSIRWGIIGLGDVCQKKSGPAFWKCQGSQLVAVMRRTPGKAQEFASTKVPKDNGECVGYDNIEAFLKHDGLEAVYVSTRPGTHLEICTKVAQAGLPVYVEKPVGRCAQETEWMVQEFTQQKLPFYTAYISRAYDRTQAIRQLLRQEEAIIGTSITRVSYKLVGTGGARDMDTVDLPWRLDASQSGGGLIMDVGCHVLDRIDYLCGPIVNVQGKATTTIKSDKPPQGVVEDYVELKGTIGPSTWSAISSEGASVECMWDFAGATGDACDELILQGSNGGYLKMAGMSPNGPIQVIDSKGTMVKELSFEMPEHTAQQLIQAVTNDLLRIQKGGNIVAPAPSPDYLSFGENAIRTQKVIDTVLESYYGGREIGYWNRPNTWPGALSS